MLDKIYETSAANNRTILIFVNLLWIPRYLLPAWGAGTTILFVVPARQAGRIDSRAPETFTNTGSALTSGSAFLVSKRIEEEKK
jgi:hypothetical protein